MSIHIEDLTVRFKNGVTAINHANLNIPNGIFGLLGENGAGKTTLMRVLTTVLKPTSGTVTLDRILYSEGNYEKIQRKIGYLPQEIDLYPNLTVQECLEYMGDLAGVPKAECKKRIEYYLKKTSYFSCRISKILGHRSDSRSDFQHKIIFCDFRSLYDSVQDMCIDQKILTKSFLENKSILLKNFNGIFGISEIRSGHNFLLIYVCFN